MQIERDPNRRPIVCTKQTCDGTIQARNERIANSHSILGRWTAPSREVNSLLALSKLHCRYKCPIKITLGELAFDPSPQKICPQKFAKWSRVLCESPSTPQFAR